MDRLHLAALSAAAALGDETRLKKQFRVWLSGEEALLPLTELLLQTALFAGVPRCLNAFRLFHDAVDLLEAGTKEKKITELKKTLEPGVEQVAVAGGRTFQKVYGDKHLFLREALKKWHPFLEEWVIKSAYGEILSRKGLTLPEREIAAVAALTAMNLPLQLWGHMRGALNQGLPVNELKTIIKSLHEVTEHTEMALKMLEGFDE